VGIDLKKGSMVEDRFFTEHEISALIGRAVQSLRNDRSSGIGLPYYKVGRSVRYRLSDVMAWMDTQRIEPGQAAIR
jgi:hypothetical protein